MLTAIIDIFFLLIIANVAYTSHIRKAHSYLDLHIKFSPTDDNAIICGNDLPCSIPYALSVLHSPNHFDLQSIMMQDGGLLRYSHNRYSDSTVIRLTKAMKLHNNGKIYLGLRFFDLPIDMQDYIIMDVMMVIENGIKGKLEMITENYRLHIRVTKELERNYDLSSDYIDNNTLNTTNCECIRKNCACCVALNVAKIDLNDFGCVNITYIAEDIGIRLSFSINGHVFISRELSLVNPPPYCLSLPFLKEYAGICLRLRNLRFRHTTLDGCVELDAELYHVHVATVHLGCFSIPI